MQHGHANVVPVPVFIRENAISISQPSESPKWFWQFLKYSENSVVRQSVIPVGISASGGRSDILKLKQMCLCIFGQSDSA